MKFSRRKLNVINQVYEKVIMRISQGKFHANLLTRGMLLRETEQLHYKSHGFLKMSHGINCILLLKCSIFQSPISEILEITIRITIKVIAAGNTQDQTNSHKTNESKIDR